MNIDVPLNHLLAALPAGVKKRLEPHMEYVALAGGEILLVGDSEHYIHFPADAIIGVLQVLANGTADGVFLVGNEGMVGVSYCLGAESSPNRAIVLGPGWTYRIPASRILDEFRHDSSLLKLTLRYTQTRIAQAAATLACNRHHSIRQQLSRFLLMYMDRLPGDQLSVTQEVIAQWLGVRRESVSEAANELRKLRVIDYQRGHITVLHKPRLEMLTCECYSSVRQETLRVLAWERQYAVANSRASRPWSDRPSCSRHV
jgi:CRP-like cAMP-binding protein